jgi:hypothetical protein
VTLKVYRWPFAQDYIEGLAPEKQEQVTEAIDQLARGFPPEVETIGIDGSDNVLQARLTQSEMEHGPMLLIEVRPEARDRALKVARRRRAVTKPRLTREQAAAIVEAGIGKGAGSPSGTEYVESIRHIWKGLSPRAERNP